MVLAQVQSEEADLAQVLVHSEEADLVLVQVQSEEAAQVTEASVDLWVDKLKVKDLEALVSEAHQVEPQLALLKQPEREKRRSLLLLLNLKQR